jgi:hypothetical protein
LILDFRLGAVAAFSRKSEIENLKFSLGGLTVVWRYVILTTMSVKLFVELKLIGVDA